MRAVGGSPVRAPNQRAKQRTQSGPQFFATHFDADSTDIDDNVIAEADSDDPGSDDPCFNDVGGHDVATYDQTGMACKGSLARPTCHRSWSDNNELIDFHLDDQLECPCMNQQGVWGGSGHDQRHPDHNGRDLCRDGRPHRSADYLSRAPTMGLKHWDPIQHGADYHGVEQGAMKTINVGTAARTMPTTIPSTTTIPTTPTTFTTSHYRW